MDAVAKARQGRHGGPADGDRRPIPSRRSPTACRRSSRARCPPELIVFNGQPDLCRSTARCCCGRQHDLRRLHQHRDQRRLRARSPGAGSPAGPERPVDLRRQRRLAGRLRAHPAGSLAAAVRPPVAGTPAGAGGGHRELDPADGDRQAASTGRRSRPTSTARRCTRRSTGTTMSTTSPTRRCRSSR